MYLSVDESTVTSDQLRRELEKSEERWKFALEGSGDGVWDWNVQTNEVFFSIRWKEMLGFQEEEIQNHVDEWSKRVHPDDMERVTDDIQRHFSRQTPIYINEHRVRCKDGAYKWILDRGKVMSWTEDGQPLRMVGTHTDMSERRRMEDALKESRRMYMAIFDQSPIAIELYDAGGVLNMVNRACLDMFGIADSKEIQGFNLFDDPNISGDAKSRLLKGSNVRVEFDFSFDLVKKLGLYQTCKEGSRRLDVSITPLKSGDEISGYLAQIQDITEHRLAEVALRQSETNFGTFFNTIADFLFVLDMEGNMILVNDTVVNRLGYARGQLVGKSVLMVHPADRRAEAQGIIQDMLQGRQSQCPIPLECKDGRQIPVETRVIEGTWNGRQALFGVSKDISELKVSEEKFSKAFHTSAALMAFSTSEEGRFIDVNDVFLQTLGFSREEVIGRTSLELGMFIDGSQRQAIREEVTEKGMVRNVEATVRAKDGSTLVGLLSATPVYIQNTPYLLTTMNDITERKHLENSLQEQLLFLQTLIDTIPNPVFYKDAGGRYLGCNKAFEAYYGVNREILLGKTVRDFLPMNADLTGRIDREVIEKRRSVSYETMLHRPDGAMRSIIISKGAYFLSDGRVGGIVGVVTDVTERKEAEARLRDSEERYRTAIEHSNDGVVIFHDAKFLYVNRRFLDLFGYAADEEILGKTMETIIHPRDARRVMDTHSKGQRGNSMPQGYEFRGIKKNGEEILIEVSATTSTYNDQVVLLAYMRDITDRKKAEEERVRHEKLQGVLEMAGTICHEMNQPLQVILGNVEFLSITIPMDTKARKSLDAIKRQTERMGSITKQLMSMKEYVTCDYVGTLRIIDINGNSEGMA